MSYLSYARSAPHRNLALVTPPTSLPIDLSRQNRRRRHAQPHTYPSTSHQRTHKPAASNCVTAREPEGGSARRHGKQPRGVPQRAKRGLFELGACPWCLAEPLAGSGWAPRERHTSTPSLRPSLSHFFRNCAQETSRVCRYNGTCPWRERHRSIPKERQWTVPPTKAKYHVCDRQ